MISIADVKRRTPPVARKNVVNANGSKSGNCSRHASAIDKPSISKPSTSKANTELDPQLEGCRHILPPVTFRDLFRLINREVSSPDKGLSPLTILEEFSRVPDQSLPTMEVASSQASGRSHRTKEEASSQVSGRSHRITEEVNSQASVPCLHTMEEVNFQANVLYPHTTAEVSSPVRGPSLRTRPLARPPVSALFPLIMAAELCQAPNLSLLTIPGVSCRAPLNLSPLT